MGEKECQHIKDWEIAFPISLPGNRWETTWCLRLESLHTSSKDFNTIAAEISQEIRDLLKADFDYRYSESDYPVEADDYILRFELISEQELHAVLNIGRYVRTDGCWILAPVWLFVRIEQMIGPIRLIQNEPKEGHFFWRYRRKLLGDECPI
jgi:hypothetical protein